MSQYEKFNFKKYKTLTIGIYTFLFDDMSPFQAALLTSKLNALIDEIKDDMWPIGEIIYLLDALCVPFHMKFHKPVCMTDNEAEKIYESEFLPFYNQCIEAGIIKN